MRPMVPADSSDAPGFGVVFLYSKVVVICFSEQEAQEESPNIYFLIYIWRSCFGTFRKSERFQTAAHQRFHLENYSYP